MILKDKIFNKSLPSKISSDVIPVNGDHGRSLALEQEGYTIVGFDHPKLKYCSRSGEVFLIESSKTLDVYDCGEIIYSKAT